MARTALTTQAVAPVGAAAALTAATVDGEIVDVGKDHTLVVHNASAGSVDVTVQTPLQINGVDVAEVTLAVPAGQTGFIALDSQMFRRTSAPDLGKAYVNCAPQASVTLGVIQR